MVTSKYNYPLLATNATHIKIKHLQSCLDICVELKELIDLIADKKIEIPENDVAPPDTNGSEQVSFKSCYALLNLVKQRLQYVLRILTKLCLTKPPPNKDCPKLVEIYKSCYVLTFELVDGLEFYTLAGKLKTVLGDIQAKLNEFKSVT